MPLRLIWYIFVLVCIFVFIGLNTENSSDINFWFTEGSGFQDVPIFISFFVMYILGAISVIPFMISSDLKKQKKIRELKNRDTAGKELVKKDKKVKKSLFKKKESEQSGVHEEEKTTI